MSQKVIPMVVFGTLRDEDCRARHDVYPTEVHDATLEGYRKEGLNIIENSETDVPGNYFLVDEGELARLDRYEGVEHNFYHRFLTNVVVGGKQVRAYAYQIVGTKPDAKLV